MEKLKAIYLLEMLEENPKGIWELFHHRQIKLDRFISEFSDYEHTLSMLNGLEYTNTLNFVENSNLFIRNTMSEMENIQSKYAILDNDNKDYSQKLEGSEKPQDSSELIDELFQSLRYYRDKNKYEFIKSFDGMLRENKKILENEIKALYDKEDNNE